MTFSDVGRYLSNGIHFCESILAEHELWTGRPSNGRLNHLEARNEWCRVHDVNRRLNDRLCFTVIK